MPIPFIPLILGGAALAAIGASGDDDASESVSTDSSYKPDYETIQQMKEEFCDTYNTMQKAIVDYIAVTEKVEQNRLNLLDNRILPFVSVVKTVEYYPGFSLFMLDDEGTITSLIRQKIEAELQATVELKADNDSPTYYSVEDITDDYDVLSKMNEQCRESRNVCMKLARVAEFNTALNNLLERLDRKFAPMLMGVKSIISASGTDYLKYPEHQQTAIELARDTQTIAELAVTTDLFDNEGDVSEDAVELRKKIEEILEK